MFDESEDFACEQLEITADDREEMADAFDAMGQDVSEFDDEPDAEDFEPEFDDSMDGDFDSAMRDAGFGTDEDYGYYGYDEY